MRIFLTHTALAASLFLAACTYGGYGRGYSSVSVGYSSYPYWGWYNNYYYPGVGIYVYDVNRHRHRWSDSHRAYWTERQTHWRNQGDRRRFRSNWNDFERGRRDRDDRRDRRN